MMLSPEQPWEFLEIGNQVARAGDNHSQKHQRNHDEQGVNSGDTQKAGYQIRDAKNQYRHHEKANLLDFVLTVDDVFGAKNKNTKNADAKQYHGKNEGELRECFHN